MTGELPNQGRNHPTPCLDLCASLEDYLAKASPAAPVERASPAGGAAEPATSELPVPSTWSATPGAVSKVSEPNSHQHAEPQEPAADRGPREPGDATQRYLETDTMNSNVSTKRSQSGSKPSTWTSDGNVTLKRGRPFLERRS